MLIFSLIFFCSVEEAKDFSTDMLGTSLVVVHDTLVGGENNGRTSWRNEQGQSISDLEQLAIASNSNEAQPQ